MRAAGITVCSGGIIGMGESVDDRCDMLRTLANLDPQPESVPINALVPMAGTPLGQLPPVDPLDLVRMIAVARILMPQARVRLSAGRTELTREAQLLAMYAGANSIFYGDKLLTTTNPGRRRRPRAPPRRRPARHGGLSRRSRSSKRRGEPPSREAARGRGGQEGANGRKVGRSLGFSEQLATELTTRLVRSGRARTPENLPTFRPPRPPPLFSAALRLDSAALLSSARSGLVVSLRRGA